MERKKKRAKIRHKFRLGQDVFAKPFEEDGDSEVFHCRVVDVSLVNNKPVYSLSIIGWNKAVYGYPEAGMKPV